MCDERLCIACARCRFVWSCHIDCALELLARFTERVANELVCVKAAHSPSTEPRSSSHRARSDVHHERHGCVEVSVIDGQQAYEKQVILLAIQSIHLRVYVIHILGAPHTLVWHSACVVYNWCGKQTGGLQGAARVCVAAIRSVLGAAIGGKVVLKSQRLPQFKGKGRRMDGAVCVGVCMGVCVRMRASQRVIELSVDRQRARVRTTQRRLQMQQHVTTTTAAAANCSNSASNAIQPNTIE